LCALIPFVNLEFLDGTSFRKQGRKRGEGRRGDSFSLITVLLLLEGILISIKHLLIF
jgi:hypothetical protein